MPKGEKNEVLESRDFKPHDSAALAYLNEDAISAQRGVILYLAKKIGVNLLTGNSIMNISLPIKIFEPRSFLEKIAADFSYAPYFLTKAHENEDPFIRYKWVISWLIGSCHLEPQMIKPFNPILGETFQGSFGQFEIAIEQISHHPPISSFQIWSKTIEGLPEVSGYF